MHHHYKSDFPNQTHQLNWSISQNYYLLKNGDIKYQVKKFDVNWNDYEKTGKRHLVNYLIRDHFSNCFYAEAHPIDKMPSVPRFLFNAWKEKEQYEFCGIPKNLILGRHVIKVFPELSNFSKIGVNLELAQNGFSTGIRALRDWERKLRYYTDFFNDYKSIEGFQKNIQVICRHLNLWDSGKTEPNLEKWVNGKPQPIVINDWADFERYLSKKESATKKD